MSTPTLDRLKWVMEQLQVLADNEWVRYEGRQKFAEAKAELDDVIATYVDNSAMPVPVTLGAMTPEQVDSVLDRLTERNRFSDVAVIEAIVSEVVTQTEQSDLAVMTAITQSQGEIITALTPA